MGKGALTIWTIGHSNRSFDEFVGFLTGPQIELVADVRRYPGSKRYPHFNSAKMAQGLSGKGVDYRHFPGLGGRRRPNADSVNVAWKHEAFRAYADYMHTEEFEGEIAVLAKLAAQKRVAIMCAEALWWQCHRRLLADYFVASGGRVLHIVGGGKLQEHVLFPGAKWRGGRLYYERAEG